MGYQLSVYAVKPDDFNEAWGSRSRTLWRRCQAVLAQPRWKGFFDDDDDDDDGDDDDGGRRRPNRSLADCVKDLIFAPPAGAEVAPRYGYASQVLCEVLGDGALDNSGWEHTNHRGMEHFNEVMKRWDKRIDLELIVFHSFVRVLGFDYPIIGHAEPAEVKRIHRELVGNARTRADPGAVMHLGAGPTGSFWTADVRRGNRMVTHQGRIGRPGRTSTRKFKYPYEVKAAYERAVAARFDRGYVVATPAAPVPRLKRRPKLDPDTEQMVADFTRWIEVAMARGTGLITFYA